MGQPSLLDYMNDDVIPESNTQTKKVIKENVIEENDDQISELNGIIEVRYGNVIYKVWKVEFIKQFMLNFLKEKYPNSLIIRELNDIDFTIFDKESNNIIPVEIQKTPIHSSGRFSHTVFENLIRKGIEDNIETSKICWLFMDSEYLKFLQSENVGKNTSINMTWLVKLIKENTLKVFTIKYDGVVKELTTKDFDFLKDISQTCVIGYDNDERVLNRNKLEIYKKVIYGYNFTQEEIYKFEKCFDNRVNKKDKIHSTNFYIKSKDERCKLYGYIWNSIGSLPSINSCLDMNDNEHGIKSRMVVLGIIEVVGNHIQGRSGNRVKFVDKFDICKYFPGYLRQERHWLTYKGNELDGKTFSNMCRGWYKNAKTMFDY